MGFTTLLASLINVAQNERTEFFRKKDLNLGFDVCYLPIVGDYSSIKSIPEYLYNKVMETYCIDVTRRPLFEILYDDPLSTNPCNQRASIGFIIPCGVQLTAKNGFKIGKLESIQNCYQHIQLYSDLNEMNELNVISYGEEEYRYFISRAKREGCAGSSTLILFEPDNNRIIYATSNIVSTGIMTLNQNDEKYSLIQK